MNQSEPEIPMISYELYERTTVAVGDDFQREDILIESFNSLSGAIAKKAQLLEVAEYRKLYIERLTEYQDGRMHVDEIETIGGLG